MKKIRTQPSFASLTEAELEQLAEQVQRETYESVRERICKPRSEGGLDLHFTSNSPLERLHAKKNRLDLVNARLCAECADRKKLTLAELNSFISMEKRAPEEVHDAILGATYNLVTEGDNTPHQLLALQRLADFPARAALRDQMVEIRASKEQRAQAKAQRDAEMHTHKTTLDLRKFEHKLEMDTFHQHIATERLNLKRQTIALREKLAQLRLNPSLNPNLFPHTEFDVQRPHVFPVRCEDNSHRPIIRILVDEDGEPFTRFPTPNPLPDDIVIKNRAYTKKLLAGLVDPDTGEELDEPTPASLAALSQNETSLNRSDLSGGDQGEDSSPSAPIVPISAPADSHPESNPGNPLQNPQQNQTSDPESPSSPIDLSSAVNSYTVRRAEEYWAHRRLHSDPPRPRQTTPKYITAFRHCPCGQGTASTPCPVHESAEFGPFPITFGNSRPTASITPSPSASATCPTAILPNSYENDASTPTR